MSKYSSLVKIPKHSGYYRNESSGKITYRRNHKGIPVKISTGKKNISGAKAVVEEKLAIILGKSKNEIRLEKNIKNPLITEIWDECIKRRNHTRSASTIETMGVAWRNCIIPFWGDKYLSDVNEVTILQYEEWWLSNQFRMLGGKKIYKDFYNARKYLQMLFRYMHEEGYTRKSYKTSDLSARIRKLNKDLVSPPKVFTEEELRKLYDAGDELCKLGIWFGARMGLRKMEFMSLEWANIDFKKRIAYIWSNKGIGTRREVPIPKEFLDKLADRKKKSNSIYVFPQLKDKSKHMAGQYFDKSWNKAKTITKISGKVHELRKTFATMTARNNWPIAIATQILGHTVKEYVKTYVIPSDGDKKDLVDSLGGFGDE